jgi:hypothetical protein
MKKFILFLFFNTLVFANSDVLYRSIEDLTIIADDIVEGSVEDVKVVWDEKKHFIHTITKIKVETTYKNKIKDDEIILSQVLKVV